jgi:hypothetical protein
MSIEQLIFNNVELLGYTHQNNFFGDKSFNYSITKNITLQGFVLDLQNTNGVKKIFNDTNQIKKLSQNFYQIIINNQNYGIGKIISLNFDAGNWVKTTRFNIEIEILQEVSLSNLGPAFTDINLTNKNFNLIKSFDESFSIEFDNQNKIIGGEHQIDIEYNANNKNANLINLAKRLALELLKTLPTDLSEGNYLVRDPGTFKVLYNETYDIINGKCGFNKKFNYGINNGKPFSIDRKISIDLNEEGIATAKEDCTIKAENNIPSLYDCAVQGLNEELPGSFNRCQNVFNFYKSNFDIDRNLNASILEKNIKINKFNGIIEYSIIFNNDKRSENQTYTWENTLTLDKDQNNIWNVSERGNINGIGKSSLIENIKYNNVEIAWNSIKNNIFSRIDNFWGTYAIEKASSALKIINTSVTRSPYQGTINYDYNYTDDPSLRNDLNDIKKLTVEISDDGRAGSLLPPIFKEFIIPNQNYTLIHNRNLKRQGSFSITLNAIVGIDNSNIFNGYSYFNQLKSIANSIYNGGNTDKYIESIDYNSNEIDQEITYSINFKYS